MRQFFDYLIFLFLLLLSLFALWKVFSGTLGLVVSLLCIAVYFWVGFLIVPKLDRYRNSRRIERAIANYFRQTRMEK